MSKADEAENLLKEGFSCAQAIFAVYASEHGMDKTMAMKLSQVFGGSIVGIRGECGVVTGAYMVIGLVYGSDEADNGASKVKTYELVKHFNRRFKELNQSTDCRDLLEGRMGNQFDICKDYLRTACDILDELLVEKAE